MASPTPTERAKEALDHSVAVRQDLELLKQLVDLHDLPGTRDLLVRVEARIVAFEKFEAEIRRIGIIDDRVNKLEKREEESSKRGWQFVYIIVGAGLALASSFLVQLAFLYLKK